MEYINKYNFEKNLIDAISFCNQECLSGFNEKRNKFANLTYEEIEDMVFFENLDWFGRKRIKIITSGKFGTLPLYSLSTEDRLQSIEDKLMIAQYKREFYDWINEPIKPCYKKIWLKIRRSLMK